MTVELDGKLYVLGGTSFGHGEEALTADRPSRGAPRRRQLARRHLADVCVWDEGTSAWQPSAPMQTGRSRFAAVSAQVGPPWLRLYLDLSLSSFVKFTFVRRWERANGAIDWQRSGGVE